MVKQAKSMLLYGRISVFERLKSNPGSVKKVLLQENISLPETEKLVRDNNIPSERLPLRKLQAVKPAKDLQGVVARVDKFRYTSFEGLLDRVKKSGLTLLFLDRINDPQNLGSIIRTAACFGRFAIVIPQFNACGVTEAVLHVASGGENHVSVSIVPNILNAIIKAKSAGCWIAGAEADGEVSDVENTSFPFPLGLVLGSEGEGIRYGVRKHLDLRVRIPMRGAELSFNVGIACAILCFEISRQRKESHETK